jgi:predicted nuclease of predicted toxin-antitoxin system
VKLLFDENVSYRLVDLLSKEFAESTHVRLARLNGADDQKIWKYARDNGFVIVSKDTDFRDRSAVEGAPPKVVWLDVGNAGTEAIEGLLKVERLRIESFCASEESSFLILSIGAHAV